MRDKAVNWICVAAVVLMPAIQGCKRHSPPATVQPVVRSQPKVVQPEIPGPLPVGDADQAISARRGTHRRSLPQQPNPSAAEQSAADAAAQRRQDAKLFQQQQAASQAQQQELNQEVQQGTRARQQVQDEPRIQDAPEPPASSGLGPDAPRIQDSPGMVPGANQGNNGQEPPRIQDAPGPSQTPSQTQPPSR